MNASRAISAILNSNTSVASTEEQTQQAVAWLRKQDLSDSVFHEYSDDLVIDDTDPKNQVLIETGNTFGKPVYITEEGDDLSKTSDKKDPEIVLNQLIQELQTPTLSTYVPSDLTVEEFNAAKLADTNSKLEEAYSDLDINEPVESKIEYLLSQQEYYLQLEADILVDNAKLDSNENTMYSKFADLPLNKVSYNPTVKNAATVAHATKFAVELANHQEDAITIFIEETNKLYAYCLDNDLTALEILELKESLMHSDNEDSIWNIISEATGRNSRKLYFSTKKINKSGLTYTDKNLYPELFKQLDILIARKAPEAFTQLETNALSNTSARTLKSYLYSPANNAFETGLSKFDIAEIRAKTLMSKDDWKTYQSLCFAVLNSKTTKLNNYYMFKLAGKVLRK